MSEGDRRQSSEIIALAQRFKQEGNVQGVVNKGKTIFFFVRAAVRARNIFFLIQIPAASPSLSLTILSYL